MARIDWEAIEAEYRTGQTSVRALAKKFGVSDAGIRKKAKSEGWEKDLTQQVRVATRAKSKKKTVVDDIQKKREEAGEDTSAPLTDSEIIEAAAEHGATVIQQHQHRITRFQNITDRFIDLLSNQMSQGTLEVLTKSGEATQIDVPLDYVGKSLASGTMALDRLVKLERQAHGLDEEGGNDEGESLDSLLAKVAPDECSD